MSDVCAKMIIQMKMPSLKKTTHISRESHTLIISLISQTIFKQLQMQPLKHPCIVWGVYMPDIVLPWQKFHVKIYLSFTNCNVPSRTGSFFISRNTIPTKYTAVLWTCSVPFLEMLFFFLWYLDVACLQSYSMSFKISDSYTTCSVWLAFSIVVKKV